MSYTSELVNVVLTSSTIEPQWFIVRGWLDSQEWGDEPLDPDDVWAVGDRVRLKGTTVEGTIQLTREQLFLDAYLPLVLVLWDGKSIPVPIEPELLIRLTRFIPPRLTWKAPESFSNESRLKLKNSSGGKCKVCDPETPKGGERSYVAKPVLEEQACSKPKFEATARSAVGQQDTLRDKPLALRSQPYRNTFDASSKVLRDETPFSLEKTQQPPKSIIHVTSSSSGSLYRYLKNVRLKSGEIASYPRVVERDPDNLNHWYWGYNYKVKEDGSWKSRSLSLPRDKVRMVQRMIERDAPVDEIRASLKVLKDESVSFLEKEDSTAASPDLEKVLRDDLSFSLERLQASGSLCSYLKNKKLKSGVIATYPCVEGTRNPDNLNHWYWSYCYEVLVEGKWIGRSLSVPKHKVAMVQKMIGDRLPVSAIKAFLGKEKPEKSDD